MPAPAGGNALFTGACDRTPMSNVVQPVILSGGAGTRLWPLSRRAYPKQLLPLIEADSMLQATARRVHGGERFAAPLIVCNDEHRFVIAEQLRSIGIEPRDILLEPLARNTAPAIAAAALHVAASDPEAMLLVLPSDHRIGDVAAFHAAVDSARAAAGDGALVTFGIRPGHAETGYGYIRRGAPLAGHADCFEVAAFVEKPTPEKAEAFLRDGGYDWNSGMFVFRADSFLAELQAHQPEILENTRAALAQAEADLTFTRLAEGPFAANPSISLDYAVMERTDTAAVVAADFGWSDVGSWAALWEVTDKDAAGNVTRGDVHLADTTNSYVRAEKRLVATLGIDGVIVVETPDVVLVADRDRVQSVKDLVDGLTAEGREEVSQHARVYRPWGYYESIDAGDRFQVKHLCVKPGKRLSLQSHHHRAEHWIVVQGTARVTRDDDVILLEENQSTYIPVGTRHRLENPGKIELKIIEVQSGSYLGEDDIVRFDDDFGRDDKT